MEMHRSDASMGGGTPLPAAAAAAAAANHGKGEETQLDDMRGGGQRADVSSASIPKARSLAAGQVDRIVSAALQDGTHVSRDARIAFQKVSTMSLLYLACLAEDERLRDSRKRSNLTVYDVKSALKAAGMAHLVPLLNTGHTKRARSEDRTPL